MSDLLDKIGIFEARLAELETKLADPALAKDRRVFAQLGQELAAVRPVVEAGPHTHATERGLGQGRIALFGGLESPARGRDAGTFRLQRQRRRH